MNKRAWYSIILVALFLTVQGGLHVWHAYTHHNASAHHHEAGINAEDAHCALCDVDVFQEAEEFSAFSFYRGAPELVFRYLYTSFSELIFSVQAPSRAPPALS